MKCSPKLTWALPAVALAAVFIARAEFVPGSDDTVAGSALEAALFRVMGLPAGTVVHARPPWEAKKHVTELLQKSPQDTELYSLRAREEELLQDYAGAEADWRSTAAKSQDKPGALSELAAFFGRRNQARQQVAALLELGTLPESPQWKAFGEAAAVADNAQLSAADHAAIYQAWMKRFPKLEEPYQSYLNWLIAQKDLSGAGTLAERMRAAFPQDPALTLNTDASLARLRGGAMAALAVYASQFSPLWPESLAQQYFQELSNAHQLRVFLANAQAEAASSPTRLAPAGRLYFYYAQQQRKDVADQQLLTFEARRSAQGVLYTAAELKTVAALFERVQDYDESAHAYYQLYALPASSAADKEFALVELIELLLDVPEKPLHFGERDLSLYKNIAGMDRHPGFLNGILTFALNYTFPENQYQQASQTAVSYFHRASASRLLDQLQRQFPGSQKIPGLQAQLFNGYAVYGQHDAIIRYVPGWLQRNRGSEAYIDTALLLADAYIALNNSRAELSLYDSLLTELANDSGHVPIGEAGLLGNEGKGNARSPNYVRVLDRYISRLVQLNRSLDAIALLRREIDRNPDDPGIYERLALFVEQNRLESDLEQTYKAAFARFRDASWASKLARFYLRNKRYSDYQALTRQVTDTFKGSVVAPFLIGIPPESPVLYRQINVYAHQRFPHNITFVRNLLGAYRQKETYDASAYEQLLRSYWFYDEGLRQTFFEMLSRTGKLQHELAALPSLERATSDSNLAALQFSAGGHAWLTEYEAAAPAFARLAELIPGDRGGNEQAISIERSLGASNNKAFAAAVKFARQDVNAAPAERATVTRVGEIYADRERYALARPWWNRVAALQPGVGSGYLDSASVFWDYFQFNDALRIIAEARQRLRNPAQFSYEAGAIFENQGKDRQAIAAYIDGVLHESSSNAQSRLSQLAGRRATAALVEQQTARLMNGQFDAAAFGLRLAVLEKQNRRPEIQVLLSTAIGHANNPGDLEPVRNAAGRLGFDRIAADAMRRTIAMTTNPVEKLQAQLDLGHFYESHNDLPAAEAQFSSAFTANPNRLGVLRAAVDFYWRGKQSAKAVQTLLDASGRAQPPYQAELRREAAEKATNSGQYDTARTLLDQLLAANPWNGDLLAEKALTYARQNDSAGLVSFYAAELGAMRRAPAGVQAKSQLAALRRGYIAALIAVGNNTEAVEQYQLIINSFPEDSGLIAEASRFAEQHQLAERLVAYYAKAVSDSRRDYRWPLVLARIDTTLRRYPEAIGAYDKAGIVRPDRADIFLAKADLQTRLLRFEDALNTYAKLYELTFHDTQYLVKQGVLNGRLGRQADALKLCGPHTSIRTQTRRPVSWQSCARRQPGIISGRWISSFTK